MPAVSKRQFRFFGAIASGNAKNKSSGLTSKQAKEYLHSTRSYKILPENASINLERFTKLKKKMQDKK